MEAATHSPKDIQKPKKKRKTPDKLIQNNAASASKRLDIKIMIKYVHCAVHMSLKNNVDETCNWI